MSHGKYTNRPKATKISDPTQRFMYVESPLNQSQLTDYIKDFITKNLKFSLVGVTIVVNQINNSEGEYLGYSHVFISDSRILQAILCLDEKGKHKFLEVQQSKYTQMTSEEVDARLKELYEKNQQAISASEMNWAEVADDDVEQSILENLQKGIIPTVSMIKRPELPLVECDERHFEVVDRFNKHMEFDLKKSRRMKVVDGNRIEPHFEVSQGYPALEGHHKNQLIFMCRNKIVPEDYLLKKVFLKPERSHIETIDGKPTVVMTYSETDAIFCRLMLRNLTFDGDPIAVFFKKCGRGSDGPGWGSRTPGGYSSGLPGGSRGHSKDRRSPNKDGWNQSRGGHHGSHGGQSRGQWRQHKTQEMEDRPAGRYIPPSQRTKTPSVISNNPYDRLRD